MNSQIVRAFLSLDDEDEKNGVSQTVQKSFRRLSNILNKSLSSNSKHQTLLEVQIVNQDTKQLMCKMDRVSNAASISAIKDTVERKYPQYYKSRQSLSLDPSETQLKDYDTLADFNLANECTLYFHDLGPQIRWSTVFNFQYAGPLFLYLFFFARPPYVYETDNFQPGSDFVVQLAAGCHTFHYIRRLLETRFIHRFSRGALPVTDLVMNSLYYWTFGSWISFFVNHPQYTTPFFGISQIYVGLGIFMIGEIGNFSIHLALNNVKIAGDLKRRIVFPSKNPFTWLFSLVSCPNYTYELITWIGFAIMTQTIVVLFFVAVGFFQMARWAITRHRSHRRQYPEYPKSRRAILPFVL